MSLTASLVRGTASPPLIEHTIGEALALAAARWGDGEALVSVEQDIRWTFADLLEQVDRFAAGLLALGLEPGERIGIWAPNCAEWTVTQFAAARAGLILVTINPAYRATEAAFTIAKAGLAALVFAERFKTSDYAAIVAEIANSFVAMEQLRSLLISFLAPRHMRYDPCRRRSRGYRCSCRRPRE